MRGQFIKVVIVTPIFTQINDPIHSNSSLCNKFICDGLDQLRLLAPGIHKVSLQWRLRQSLTDDLLSLLLCLASLQLIRLHSLQEVLAATRVLHMFNTHIDTLLDDAMPSLKEKEEAACMREGER